MLRKIVLIATLFMVALTAPVLAFPVDHFSALVQVDDDGLVTAIDTAVRIEKYAGSESLWEKVIVPKEGRLKIGQPLPAGAFYAQPVR